MIKTLKNVDYHVNIISSASNNHTYKIKTNIQETIHNGHHDKI